MIKPERNYPEEKRNQESKRNLPLFGKSFRCKFSPLEVKPSLFAPWASLCTQFNKKILVSGCLALDDNLAYLAQKCPGVQHGEDCKSLCGTFSGWSMEIKDRPIRAKAPKDISMHCIKNRHCPCRRRISDIWLD